MLLLFSMALISGHKSMGQSRDMGKPNIILLIADDMGYADLQCYGGVSETPNINMLAETGIVFSDFYAAASNCSPSRAGLLTGISPSKLGMYSYRPPNHPMHLKDSDITIAEILKEKGYRTGHFGKWHLGCLPQDKNLNHPQPHDQGFDHSFGTENNSVPSHHNPTNFVRNGKVLGPLEGYSCQLVADEVIEWLSAKPKIEDPFFMYVAFHEPHAKVESPPNLVEKYNQYSKKDAEYLASVENVDLAVGRIYSYLKKHHLLENTLILFSSDNGSYRQASNGGLRAVKSYNYDGGIRVPGIINWPKLNRKGIKISEAAGFVDIMPTLCEILNMPTNRNVDGSSILGLLNGEGFERKKPLYWYFYRTTPEIAVRVDNFMILGKDNDTVPRAHQFSAMDMTYIKEMGLKSYELYNLSEDSEERNNLFFQNANNGFYKNIVDKQLREIQESGYYWENLPEPQNIKKVKGEWVKYD